MAEALARRLTDTLAVEVASAGLLDLGPVPALDETIDAAHDVALDLSEHVARCLHDVAVDDVDLVVGFERAHLAEAVVGRGVPPEKVFLLRELVRLLELCDLPAAYDPVERARLAVAAAHELRGGEVFVPGEEVVDPYGGPLAGYGEMVRQVGDLTERLARGLFGIDAADTRDGRERISHLSVFFPAFNEEESIVALLDEALDVIPRFADRFEVIVVDDGSTDGTPDLVDLYAQEHPEVRRVSHGARLGYGEALRTGLKEAQGEAVFFTDADRQFRLSDLVRLQPRFGPRTMAIGYRIKRSDPWHRLVVAWVYHRVLRAVFDLRVRDVDCAFKLIGRPTLDRVLDELCSTSAFISPELLIRARRAGVAVCEVGVPHYPRALGCPKGASLGVILRTIREILVMRRRLGPLAPGEAELAPTGG